MDDYEFGEEETYAGLRTQDLQEAKDQLLVETADMLNLPLFTAEALLRNNGKIIDLNNLNILLYYIRGLVKCMTYSFLHITC